MATRINSKEDLTTGLHEAPCKSACPATQIYHAITWPRGCSAEGTEVLNAALIAPRILRCADRTSMLNEIDVQRAPQVGWYQLLGGFCEQVGAAPAPVNPP